MKCMENWPWSWTFTLSSRTPRWTYCLIQALSTCVPLVQHFWLLGRSVFRSEKKHKIRKSWFEKHIVTYSYSTVLTVLWLILLFIYIFENNLISSKETYVPFSHSLPHNVVDRQTPLPSFADGKCFSCCCIAPQLKSWKATSCALSRLSYLYPVIYF